MVWFVRHAQVEIDLGRPAPTWPLSAEGQASALAWRSGVELELDERLREVVRRANLPDAGAARIGLPDVIEWNR